jgi:hypothetical protein
MKIAALIARILLGLMFVVFGLNLYLHFIPIEPHPGDAGVLLALMVQHGWFKFFGIRYVVGGLLVLVGRYVPLGLVLLGPIIVNIVLFHVTLAPDGSAPGYIAAVLEIFLVYVYWPVFRGIFEA